MLWRVQLSCALRTANIVLLSRIAQTRALDIAHIKPLKIGPFAIPLSARVESIYIGFATLVPKTKQKKSSHAPTASPGRFGVMNGKPPRFLPLDKTRALHLQSPYSPERGPGVPSRSHNIVSRINVSPHTRTFVLHNFDGAVGEFFFSRSPKRAHTHTQIKK